MPEGDTLFRAAAMLRPGLEGKKVLELRLPREELGVGRRLVGQTVVAVESKGKNLLITFRPTPESEASAGTVLHTHLRMNGKWRLFPDGRQWSDANVVVVLRVDGFTAVCFQAPVVRLLREKAVARDARLGALGPDLLASDFDEDEAVRRLRSRDDQPIGVAIMDQQALAGVGNVYKSEILFIARLDPFALVATLSDDQLHRVVKLAADLLARNVRHLRTPGTLDPRWQGYERGRRVTRDKLDPGSGAVHVYGRSNRRCTTCGDLIRMARQGQLMRSTYYCPTCQRVGASATVPGP